MPGAQPSTTPKSREFRRDVENMLRAGPDGPLVLPRLPGRWSCTRLPTCLADFGFGGGDQPDVSAGVPVAVDLDGLADRLVEDQDVVGGLQSSVGV
jgi:hypothetical protein